MKYNYNNMDNISDIIGKKLNYHEAFKNALGENVSTTNEIIVVESMTEPNNTNGGMIHWLSFGGGRGIYLEEIQIIDLLNNKEINIKIEDKIAILSSTDTPSSINYEIESNIPTAQSGAVAAHTHLGDGGIAEKTWTSWSDEHRNKFLLKHRDALDNSENYYENVGNSWDQLSDNIKEILKIELKKNDVIPSAESGVLVGKSDINSREGIIAQQPDGAPIKLGGGEIIMSEKASTDNCEELSKMNVEGGGVAFDCDLQKVANTDRASGNMPKYEYHKETASGGKRLTADDMLLKPETKRRILDVSGEEGENRIRGYLAQTKNYIPNIYYHVHSGVGQAGVGGGLYLGKDKNALKRFYDIENEGLDISIYEGNPKWMDLMDYDTYNKFENDAIKRYSKDFGITPTQAKNYKYFEQKGEMIKKLALEKDFDGIRYYDPQATGEEFVLFNTNKLNLIGIEGCSDATRELSDINLGDGGIPLSRAGGKMPKDEWHRENAAKGTQVERTHYEEAHRYIENAKETLKKAGLTTDGRYYHDTKYVKSAAGIAYVGAEMAAKWYIKLRGIELKGRGIEQIKDAIAKIDGRILKIVNSFYNTLHLNIYYGNETNKKIVDAAMASAEEMVNYLKPYKEIAHYDMGKYFKYEKNSVEKFLDDYNLPGFDVKLKFDNKPETFFTLKQSRPRLTIRVKDIKNKEWMFLITRITSVDGRKVEWVDSNAAGGMEGLVPQGKLYDRSVSRMYKKLINEEKYTSTKDFLRIYEKKLKELATKYNIPPKYLELKQKN